MEKAIEALGSQSELAGKASDVQQLRARLES